MVHRGFAQKVDQGVATEGHPYENATEILECECFCRGGPPWPPAIATFCAKQSTAEAQRRRGAENAEATQNQKRASMRPS